MVIKKTIIGEDKTEHLIYGIQGKCGTVNYFYEDISDNETNAEIIDKILFTVSFPSHLIDRIVFTLAGILTESVT